MIHFISQAFILLYFFSFGFTTCFFTCLIYNISKRVKNIFLVYLINILFWIFILIIQIITFQKIKYFEIENYYFLYSLAGYILFYYLFKKKNNFF